MKNSIAATAVLVMFAACQQTTETSTTTTPTSTVETKTTTVTSTVPAMKVDTAETAEAKAKMERAGDQTAEAARDAAHATGTALESAGKKIQQKTEPKNH